MKQKLYFNEDVVRYRVKKFNPNKKLKLGIAYHLEDRKIVLPFRGKTKTLEDCKMCGIYKVGNEIKFIYPFGKKKKLYSENNIYEQSLDYINGILETEDISNKLEQNILLLDTGDVFAPPIEKSDNLLQMIVKDILIRKQVDIKAYQPRFDSATDMNNYKRSLTNHGMSEEKFRRWCEILDVDFEITYKDKKGCLNPMGDDFVGNSNIFMGLDFEDDDVEGEE